MSTLPSLCLAVALSGTTLAAVDPAPTPLIGSVVVTEDEYEALSEYRRTHVTLTPDEVAFLTDYRNRQAVAAEAAAAKEEAREPKTTWTKVLRARSGGLARDSALRVVQLRRDSVAVREMEGLAAG